MLFFFADDAFFFARASRAESLELKASLSEYEKASGRQVSLNKPAVVFSPNTTSELREEVCSILRVQEVNSHGNYLGMPSVIQRDKKHVF